MNIFKRESADQPPTWQPVLLICVGLFFNIHAIVAATIGMGYGADGSTVRLGIAGATALATSAVLAGFGWLILLRRCPTRVTIFAFAVMFASGTAVGYFAVQ